MSNTGNGKTVLFVLAIIVILLLALRWTAFVLPFGVFPGVFHVVRDAGHAVWPFGDYSVLRVFPLFLLPLFLFLLWVFVIIWVYKDAERRGMVGILWALLVFIGNVIGLLIYLIVRSDSPVRAPSQGSREKCPSCGKDAVAGFTFCPHCGARLKPVCPDCQKPVDKDWKACPHCGTPLQGGKGAPPGP